MVETEEERIKRAKFWEDYRQLQEQRAERRKKRCKGKLKIRKRGTKIYGINKK